MADPILTDADLAELRTVVNDLLPDQGVVWDKTEVRDTTGGIKTTYTQRAGTVPVRVGQVQQADRVALTSSSLDAGGQIAGKMRAAMTVPALTDIDEGDRIAVLGQMYAVLAVLAPISWEMSRRLIVEVV